MKWEDWLGKWGMNSLKVNVGFLQMEFSPTDKDRCAAWELYIELLTRITTQPLDDDGVEKSALKSVSQLFPLSREIIKRNGVECFEFTKLAIIILNQIVRPFTAKWHRESELGAFSSDSKCKEFREELKQLQIKLRNYTQMLASMADVEDLTQLEGGVEGVLNSI